MSSASSSSSTTDAETLRRGRILKSNLHFDVPLSKAHSGSYLNSLKNGHELDFSDDRQVYTLDMYKPGIYPFDYEARRYINLKVEVMGGTTTNEYWKKLDEALKVAASMFDPELVVYNAGTDILDGDPLGRLKMSPGGITNRDEKVFRFARERNIPIVMLTSGGYLKSSARVIVDYMINLSKKCLIDMGKNAT